MQRSTIAIIADVALVEAAGFSRAKASFAPTDRVTAESDSQRLIRSAELSCDYKKNNKSGALVLAAGISSCSLLFCEKLPFPYA
jgi:hypothetical protein